MSITYYPEFEPSWMLPFRVAFEGMLNDPLWLERPDCPYDDVMRESLRSIWAKFRSKPEVAKIIARPRISGSSDKWEQLGGEMTDLFDELRNFVTKIDPDDVKEQMAYYRTATALLEKITSLAERASNVKAVSDFHAAVLKVFDEVLSPEQRTQAMKMLGTANT